MPLGGSADTDHGMDDMQKLKKHHLQLKKMLSVRGLF